MGIYPGFSTFNMATNGFGCSIEIEIVPQNPQGAGGGGIVRPPFIETPWEGPYEIIVRVKHKGKTWEQRRTVSYLMAASLEKVFASFRRMNTSIVDVIATINSVLTKEIKVKAFWRK
jgi:hypothetical protein